MGGGRGRGEDGETCRVQKPAASKRNSVVAAERSHIQEVTPPFPPPTPPLGGGGRSGSGGGGEGGVGVR